MTDRMRIPYNRDAQDLSDHLIVQNVSGETIPAYGCVKLTALTGAALRYEGEKPDGVEGLHFVNGPRAVPASALFRVSLWNKPRIALLEDGALGDSVGPIAGQWEMGTASTLTGFRVFTNVNAGRAAVLQEGVGGGGSAGVMDVIPRECIGNGYYLAEIADWGPSIPVGGGSGSAGGSGSGSDSADCDECADIPIDPDEVITDFGVDIQRDTPAGTGVYVYIYDPFPLPLKLGKHAIVALPGVPVGGGSGSGSGSSELVFRVLNGYYQVIKIPHREYECCVDPDTGASFVQQTAFRLFITVGFVCETPPTPCATSGGSGGGGGSGLEGSVSP